MKIATSSTQSVYVGGAAPVENHQEIQTHSPLYTVPLIVVTLLVLLSIASAIHDWLPKIIKPLFRSKSPATVPCQKCHYFSHNPYIKCTLHPDNVLTDRAINCRDYSD